MRTRLTSLLAAGVALGSLAMVGRSAIGEPPAAQIVGYGLLMTLAAVYVVVATVTRHGAVRRVTPPNTPHANRIAGWRVF